jgi:hypothetical protein
MRLGAGVQIASVLIIDSAKDRNRPATLRKITTVFGTSVPPALPDDHENISKATGLTSYAHLSAIRLGAGVQLAFDLVDSAKDRNRPAATLRKFTTLFGTLVPPALPNDHENT